MTSADNIVAVIPAYNEGKTVGKVVRELLECGAKVVVVDDSSSDNTAQEARAAGAQVLRHTENGGYDKSINDGFKKAAEMGADVFVTFDADGEHDADDFARIVEPILSGAADIVLGQRPFTTHFSEKVFALYTKSRWGITDPLCGFKAYSRAVYDAVGYFDTVQSIGTQLMIEGLGKGFRLALVPITLRMRQNDSSRFYARRLRANIKIFKAMMRVLFV
jgi:glycosyltransferase involved in cell wall biosynthesis